MSEELKDRISEAYLSPTYKDGQVLLHRDLNEILSVVRTGINENYKDIQRVANGDIPVGNSKKIDGLSVASGELSSDETTIPNSMQVKDYIDEQIEQVKLDTDVGTLEIELSKVKNAINGSAPMGEIVVDDIKSSNIFSGFIKGVYNQTTGAYESEGNGITTEKMSVKQGKNYYLSGVAVGTVVRVHSWIDDTYVGSELLNAPTVIVPNGNIITFQTSSSASYINVQIKEGNADSEFTPNKKYGYNSVESMGNIVVDDIECKNIFDKDNFTRLNAFIDLSGNYMTASLSKIFVVTIKPNTTYTVSKTLGSRLRIATSESLITTNNTPLPNYINKDGEKSATITSRANDKYLYCFYYDGSTDANINENDIVNDIQVEKGLVATKWTKHQKFGISDTGRIAFENHGYYRKYGKLVNVEVMKSALNLTLNAGESVELGYLPTNFLPKYNIVVPAIVTLQGGAYNFNCTLIINYVTGLVIIKNQGTSSLAVYGLFCNTSYIVDDEATI